MRKVLLISIMVLAAVLSGFTTVCTAQGDNPLTNAQVIDLTKADLGDSVIIAKIKASKNVKFDLETDDLLKLRAAGVSKTVIAAMIDRSTAGSSSATSAGPRVVLSSKSGDIELKPTEGAYRQFVAPFVGLRRFVEFSPNAATTRIRDPQPRILISSSTNPERKCAYVKIYHDKKSRWIDIEAPGMWGGSISNRPYGDCLLKYSVNEEKPGLWRFQSDNMLEQADYGLYCSGEMHEPQRFVLYEFGIDR